MESNFFQLWYLKKRQKYSIIQEVNASGSIGRAAVSKIVGWGFKSLLACQKKGSHNDSLFYIFFDFFIHQLYSIRYFHILSLLITGSYSERSISIFIIDIINYVIDFLDFVVGFENIEYGVL